MAAVEADPITDKPSPAGDRQVLEELMARHLDFVYSAALRQVGDPHLADDVTQAVFMILLHKKQALRPGPALLGWLFKTVRYAAANALKAEARRRHHEQQARRPEEQPEEAEPAWQTLSGVLDEAVAGLGRKDRQAVLMRFFDGQSLRQVGAALGVSEDAARMRIGRAVERLRAQLRGKGVAVSAAALGTALAANAVQAAPGHLAGTIAAGVVGSGTASVTAAGIAKGAMTMMAWANAKVAAAVAGLGILIAGAGVIVAQVAAKPDPVGVAPASGPATRSDPPPSLNADSAQKLMMAMSQQERLDYLRRSLKQREAELERVSISFIEFVGNTRTAEARADKTFRSSIQTDLTIDGPRRLIRLKEWNDDNVLLQDSLISYNAGRKRALVNYHVVKLVNFRVVKRPPSGTIVDDPESQAMHSPFYHMLGNQVNNGYRLVGGRVVRVAMPISEALSSRPWDVQLSREDGMPVVTATFKKADGVMVWDYAWTFDLSKNWMPKRFIDRTISGPAKEYKLYEVTEAKNVDGLFLPGKMIYRYSVDSPDWKFSGDMSVEVTAAARGSRLDDGFEVVFPPGTLVVDDVEGVAYRVREGGGADPLSDDELAAALGHPPGTVTINRKKGPGVDKME